MAELDIRQSAAFRKWLDGIRDATTLKVIKRRLARVQIGLFGDVKPIGGGLSEIRIDYGPGYRIYFARRGQTIVLLLCGGDKDSQSRDIERARALAAEWEV